MEEKVTVTVELEAHQDLITDLESTKELNILLRDRSEKFRSDRYAARASLRLAEEKVSLLERKIENIRKELSEVTWA